MILDTGSRWTAFPCSDCDPQQCGQEHHLNPFFQEQQSVCFSKVSCDDCNLGTPNCLTKNGSDDYGSCTMGATYVEGSSWTGYESYDIVSLASDDAVTYRNESFYLRFACQTSLTGLFQTQLADGICGMSKSDGALWAQMYLSGLIDSQQFSLCFSLQPETSLPAGLVVFGGTDIALHKTAMVYANDVNSFYDHYKVRIRNLYLRLGGGFSVLPILNGTNNVTRVELETTATPILDSGTTCTYLPQRFQIPFISAWNQLTNIPAFSSMESTTDLSQLPTIIFQLEGYTGEQPFSESTPGMAKTLDPSNPNDILVAFPPTRYLEKARSDTYAWCFLIDDNNEGVLGNNFLAGHDVLHDIDNGRIGFAESDCNSVESPLYPSSKPPSTSPPLTDSATEVSARIWSCLTLLYLLNLCIM